jgi:hypothetical protein
MTPSLPPGRGVGGACAGAGTNGVEVSGMNSNVHAPSLHDLPAHGNPQSVTEH